MLKLDIKKQRKFISPLLSKKSITSEDLNSFQNATATYIEELEKQRIAKQSEPNIVSNALKPYFEALQYNAQSYSQKGQSGMDLALMLEHSPAVIIEAKAFDSSDMLTTNDINKKALHEAILYFMRERESGNNTIFHIIITDFYRWFVFDAKDFEKLFWKNSTIKKIFDSVKDPSILGSRTEDFYGLVAAQIAEMKENLIDDRVISCAYFDLREKRNEKENIALYKLLSKDTLLKAFNPNDANTLNKSFYNELLYILGLEEQKSGGKKLISEAKKPQSASLYENTKRNLKYAGHPQEFETIIRLMIIWINRILFLKLLESQLVKWNDDQKYRFLNIQTIDDFDKMKIFFFDILANKPHDRDHKEFGHIPYLNSSLFEKSKIEKDYIEISSLEDNCQLPYYSKTVLKDSHGQRKEGDVNMLEYLFEFLDAYDFSSEGSEELVSESKSLINASVLGLIFEKLNGYKDGSFYTPSFITMYMSRETISKAIIEKFNQTKGWACKSLDDLYDKIEDKQEANAIIDSMTIVDPAVGSGHFLVSALNTILETKSQLRILYDANGKRVKEYELVVENDELIVRDDEGEIFEYRRNSREAARIQKLLFNEKQKIIENSLFGVDINPNSAQITRLRLWIELLKHSYYDESSSLVTMPNIDINIKVGNSLISRYGLHDEIDIPNIKHAIEEYKRTVKEYKEGDFLTTKDDIRKIIEDVKDKFKLTLKAQWKQTEEYKKVLGKYVKEYGMDGLPTEIQLQALQFNFGYHGNLFDDELSATKQKEKAKLFDKVIKAHQAIEEIEQGKIYQDAFEWRFEFPEVLDDEGNFVGFDVVIGNPPYGVTIDKQEQLYFREHYITASFKMDSYSLFMERAIGLLNSNSLMAFIVPYTWLTIKQHTALRKHLLSYNVYQIIDLPTKVFQDADLDTSIAIIGNKEKTTNIDVGNVQNETIGVNKKISIENIIHDDELVINLNTTNEDYAILKKMKDSSVKLDTIFEVSQGYIPYRRSDLIKEYGKKVGNEIVDKRMWHSDSQKNNEFRQEIQGKDIDRYKYTESFQYVKYGKWLAGYVSEKFFASPRILVMEVTRGNRYKLKAIYIEKELYNTPSIINIIHPHNDKNYLKFILGCINSRLFTWYHTKMHAKANAKTSIPKILVKDIRNLPILNLSEDSHQIIEKVDQIIILKQQNQDTTHLEKEIDQMVYELYGLSDEEIAVVEGRELASDEEIGYNNQMNEEQI